MIIRLLNRVAGLGVAGVFFCLVLGPQVSATEIHRLNLDNADDLGTTVSVDPKIKIEGKGAIRILTKWPTTICLDQISKLNLENTRLVYQAKVKTENLEGAVFLEMWCQVGAGQYFARGLNSTVSGTTDWRTIETAFMLNKGQNARAVTLNLVINGMGTVWVDDVRLSEQPLN
jgi:hypothetical protein